MTREVDVSVASGDLPDQSRHKLTGLIRSLDLPTRSPAVTDKEHMPPRNIPAGTTGAGAQNGGSAASLPVGVHDSLEWLNRYLDEMSASVSAITSVSKQARLIAFNARIEAARNQSIGNSFAVIADEMKMMAVELTPITNRLEFQLFEMRHKISELSDMLDLMSEYATAEPRISPPSFQRPEPQSDANANADSRDGLLRSA
jgi:hypothetical protein